MKEGHNYLPKELFQKCYALVKACYKNKSNNIKELPRVIVKKDNMIILVFIDDTIQILCSIKS
ncbi:MAG: hypothetical protein AABZ57_04525, partial [Candidatus Margulisiibacteriota bacterium]